MSHTSPATYLVWAIISSLLGVFLLFHLWSFDRFRCLKWNNGPYSGAFKRVMTYSYLLSVPLIIAYAVGFAIIKYEEGFVVFPGLGVIPKPHVLWDPLNQSAIFPLTLCFSVAWSLEMVTHLEELCFWLFLVNAGQSAQQDWFRSLYFKTWILGSCIAVAYMPLVTIFTRGDILKCEAYTFLAGSLGSLSLTLWFTPVLWTFPSFLGSLKREGVDTATIVRLTKFHEMNSIRVIFRFMFTVPLVILGADGIRTHTHINESMLWTDLLAVIAAFGCIVSSGITLVIFFPRSIEGEIAAKDASRERKRTKSSGFNSMLENRTGNRSRYSQSIAGSSNGPSGGTYLLTSSPVKQHYSLPSHDGHEYESNTPGQPMSPLSDTAPKSWAEEELDMPASLPKSALMRPNRRINGDVELGGIGTLSETNLSRHNGMQSNVHSAIHNFTSPIDMAYGGSAGLPTNASRLTFNRR